MMEKITSILKDGNISFPKILLKKYKLMKISDIDFIILIYLLNEQSTLFNPKKIAEDIGLTMQDVLISIEKLSSKDLLKIEIIKTNNIREEHINLDNLYTKLGYFIVNEEEMKAEESSNIFDIFEKEFGRTLSPIEYQIINGWKDDNLSEEMIIEALKEATYNGVSNLRYIDKILYEWRKKGYHNKDDIEKGRMNFAKKETSKEMFDYNWLDDNDE